MVCLVNFIILILLILALKNVDVNDTTISATERITKAAWDACSKYYNSAAGFDRSGDVYSKIKDLFGDAPFLGGELKNGTNLFNAAGAIEQNNAVPNLMFSWATVDYKNVSQNALYISQPTLPMPLDFYIKPQFYDQLKKRVAGIAEMMTAFAQAVNKTVDPGDITKAATGVVDFEVQIAMASWSDDLLRNYIQQYNPYNLDGLNSAYGGIDWNQYLAQLFNGVADKNAYQNYNFVISQPPYFSWLSSIITGNLVDPNVIANYIIVNLLFDDGDFIGSSEMSRIIREYDYVPHVLRAGRGSRRVGRRYNRMLDNDGPEVFCFDIIMAYMPYGPGYVYVKSREDARNTVSTNVQQQTDLIIESFLEMQSTLTWMDDQSKQAAITKSQNLVKNYGWPSWFGSFTSDPADFKAVDDYNKEYAAIIQVYNKGPIQHFYDIMLFMKRAFEVQEAMKLLTMPADRSFFLLSPALVNAWYQPERNSITFPYAAWNPPYYSYDYPQAYNYAGQGGTGGHELTHGYDDEISFYRENLVINSFKAYNLVQMEHYWIVIRRSNVVGWMIRQTTMLTNPHAPASCRTNQVMQDIPAFGQDFNCRRGDAMFPNGSDRCKVWVGY
ncbi:hypothetical protein WR25_15853 isoform G [Diploscapter pachys]|uniref:Peptidase M13 C-terminal domain-containing protein n=1 Tax=Diploscapter pachys TaxID=2018661 RepID=A0A2A2J7J9_9BILA|nr:hypothetical protein WR25_15853 isoform A [Diploscapter pachys]PAV57733.1 hypothetical protein WR25_15853 isoform B [Diploscapter pachys]PAV57734.1 hypothetical protein WR25_15853 isoform C [Diploscapter pachys]PAV57735.1 hypothetical protein WR25_15853 isoform D [Diploscapter pachys]PAV57736.1 hypothetical protein WR25_15853 isoform E [Diploscapter pachys]